MTVTVGSPTTYGTGLGKHTRYNVQTRTTLTQVRVMIRESGREWDYSGRGEWLEYGNCWGGVILAYDILL